MGTRNLTMVIQNQETKIAQYGQWDGFPDGQGITILTFLQDKSNVEKLKQIIPNIRFEKEQDTKEKKEFAKSLGIEVKPNYGHGRILMEVFDELVETKLQQPTFITEYPAEISPLARRNDDNPEITDRFEFFIIQFKP